MNLKISLAPSLLVLAFSATALASRPPIHTPPSCSIWGVGWPVVTNAVDNYADPDGTGFATYQNTTNAANFSILLDVVANYDCPLQYTTFLAQSWGPGGYISYLRQDLWSKVTWVNPEGTIVYFQVGDNTSGRPYEVDYIDPGAGPWLTWPWGALIEEVGVAAGDNSVIVGISAPVYYTVNWQCSDCNYSPEPPPDCGDDCDPDAVSKLKPGGGGGASTSVTFALTGANGVYKIGSTLNVVVRRDASSIQIWMPVAQTATAVSTWHVITSRGGVMTLDVLTSSSATHSVLSAVVAPKTTMTTAIPTAADLAAISQVSGNALTEESALVLAIPSKPLANPTFATAPTAELFAAQKVSQ